MADDIRAVTRSHLRNDKCWTHHEPNCDRCPRYWLHSDAALPAPPANGEPRTVAGRALLYAIDAVGNFDLTIAANSILAIEAEAISLGHKEGYLSRAEDERFRADFPEATQPAPGLREAADTLLREVYHPVMHGAFGDGPDEYDELTNEPSLEACRALAAYLAAIEEKP